MKTHIKLLSLLCASSLGASCCALAADVSLEELKQQIDMLQKQVQRLEQAQKEERQASQAPKAQVKVKESMNQQIAVYGSLRPTYGYYDIADDDSWDVGDALSRIGIRARNDFMPGWWAELHGEWSVDVSNNGDFGKARNAYAALGSPFGRVAIGKMRPPQYTLVAEYVDIFNHGNSPFGYDAKGIFFINNMVSYQYKTEQLTFMAAGQYDGENGDDANDLTNVGVGFDQGNLHLGLSYLMQDSTDAGFVNGEDNVWGAVAAYSFDMGLYLAAAYQDYTYERDAVVNDRDGHSLDVTAAYPLSDHFKLKLGYFDFEDGNTQLLSQNFDGYNATLEWQPDPDLRLHLEYLHKDFEYLEDFSSVLVGFRYDFSQSWRF